MRIKKMLSLLCAAALLLGLASPATAASLSDTATSDGKGGLVCGDFTYVKDKERPTTVKITSIRYIGSGDFRIPSTLPDVDGESLTVTALGGKLFGIGGFYLSSMYIPATVTEIDPTFASTYKITDDRYVLTEFLVDAENPNYCSVDGVIYTKDMSTLINYPRYKADTSFTVPSTVTRIAPTAFQSVSKLTGITLPKGLVTIGSNAFESAAALTTVNLEQPSSLRTIEHSAFYWAQKLANITLPEGLETLGNSAFTATALTGLSIPSSVTSIGTNLLKDCNKITTVTLSCPDVPEGFLNNCRGLTSLTLTDTVKTIGADAFHACDGLTSLTIPAGVESIGKQAFYGCWGLESVTFAPGSKLTSVDEQAFYDCHKLESLKLPDSVTTLGKGAMGSCAALTDIDIPPLVTHLPDLLFSRCGGLTEVVVPDTVKTMGVQVFYDCTTYSDMSKKSPVSGLRKVTLPAGLTGIPGSTFNSCKFLDTVVIPESVTSIGSSAFKDCDLLTYIDLPDGLTEIGSDAFSGCRGLATITVPEGVTKLENKAFYWCSSLQSVILPESLTCIAGSVFEQCNALEKITFPQNLTTLDSSAFAYNPVLREVVFLGDAPASTSVANPNSPLINPFKGSEKPPISFYHADGAQGYDQNIWKDMNFKPLSERPAPPEAIEPTVKLSAILSHSRQDELILWLTVDVTPAHYQNGGLVDTALTPSGALTTTISGAGLSQPIHYSGAQTSSHRTFGYEVEQWLGQELTVQVSLAASTGYQAAVSNSVTGKVEWPKYADDDLPFIPGGGSSVDPNDYFEYFVNVGDTVTITGVNDVIKDRETIELPDTLDGKPVTDLSENLFRNCANLKYVTLPKGLTSLPEGLFKDRLWLVSAAIPEGITELPANLFQNCGHLYYTGFPSTLTQIGAGVFAGCSSLMELSVPASVATIADGAFGDGSALAHIYFEGNAPTYEGTDQPFGLGTVLHHGKDAVGFDQAPWKVLSHETGEPIPLSITGLHPEFSRLSTTGVYTLYLQSITTDPKNYFGDSGAVPNFHGLVITLDGEPVTNFEVSTADVVSFPVAESLVDKTVELTLTYQGDKYFQESPVYSRSITLTDPSGPLNVAATASAVEKAGDGYTFDLTVALTSEQHPNWNGNSGYIPSIESITYTLGGKAVVPTAVSGGRVTIPVAAEQLNRTLPLIITVPDNGHFRTTTATLDVTLTDPDPTPTLTGIEVTKAPNKTAYTVDDVLDTEGLVVTATYSVGDPKEITGYTLSHTGTLTTVGTITITVIYEGESATFEVTVTEPVAPPDPEPTLTGIAVTTQPTKTTYTVGEALDTAGLIVTAAYSDGEPKEITGYTLSHTGKFTAAGTITITVTYEEASTTFGVTVTEPVTPPDPEPTLTGIAVTTQPTKTTYTVGEALDTAGLIVTAAYSDGEPKEITGYTLSHTGKFTAAGTITITVTYEEASTTFEVTVTEPVAPPDPEPTLTGIAVTTQPTKTTYTVGEALDTAGLIVTATYSDGEPKEITGYTLSHTGKFTAAGTITITVTYEEESTTFGVTVTEPVTPPDPEPTLTGIAVTTLPDKTAYTVGEALRTEGMVVTATYSGGDTKEIADYTLSHTGALTTAGTITITVTYEEKSAAFEVTVTEPVTPPTPPSGGGGGGGGSAPATGSENAKVTVNNKAAADAVKAAADHGSVVLKADTSENAKSVAVTVPANVMKTIAKAGAPVSIQSPVADLTLDTKVLEAIQAAGAKDVVVSAGAAEPNNLPKAAQETLSGRPVYDIAITSGGKSVSQFDGGTVTVALPYTPASGEDPACLTACWVREDGTVEVLQNSIYQDGVLTFSTPHLSTYAIVHREISFLDVGEDNWARADISFASARGLLNGVGDDMFGPDAAITGSMAVVVLARMAGVSDGAPGPGWAYPALAWAEERNILPDGFAADAPLNREQLAYLVAGFLGGGADVNVPVYLDMDQVSPSCVKSVNYLTSLGLMNGTGDGYFSPTLSLSRSELAAILHRLVELRVG